MFEYSKTAAVTDAEVWKYIEDEMQRQEQHIEMIASVTTAAASSSTKSSALPLPAQRNSSANPRALRWP